MIQIQLNHPEMKRLFEYYKDLAFALKPDYFHLLRGYASGNWIDNNKSLRCYGLLKPSGQKLNREGDTVGYYLAEQNDPAKGSFCNLDWGCNRVEDNGSTFESYCGETIFQLRNNYNALVDEERGHETKYVWVPMNIAHPVQNSLARRVLDKL